MPMKKLLVIRKKTGGRDSQGRVAVRHRGGEEKRFVRLVDFRRNKALPGIVESIEYDPNRHARVSLVVYPDGERRYILAPVGLEVGAEIVSGADADIKVGNALPLEKIPMGTTVHNVEISQGRGGQIARGAGVGVTVGALEGNFIQLKLPSGEIRRVFKQCMATIGQVGNVGWKDETIGKAGRKRHMGIRPTVRGVAQNPRSHPHGGGEGRSGIGMHTPKTFAGRKAVGKTRRPKKYSNKFIVKRRGKK